MRALVYARKLGTDAPVEEIRTRVRATFSTLASLLREIPEATARDRRHGDGWTIQEVVDHMVESDALATRQLASLLAGDEVEDPIPASLQSEDPMARDWGRLRQRLGAIHESFLELLANATDAHPLTVKAPIQMVVKCEQENGELVPVSWVERFDWKAFSILVQAHDREHIAQIHRVLEALPEDPPG